MQPGVTMTGDALFASIDLERDMRATFYDVVEEQFARLPQDDKLPSDAVLLDMFCELGCPEMDLVLEAPGPVTCRTNGTAICLVAFTGSENWFWYSASTWPRMLPVRGHIVSTNVGRRLLLSAAVDIEFVPWAPVAFAAELARIQHNLGLLALLPGRINEDLQDRAHFMARHARRVWMARYNA